jgi:hypothetical protein
VPSSVSTRPESVEVGDELWLKLVLLTEWGSGRRGIAVQRVVLEAICTSEWELASERNTSKQGLIV